MNQVLTSYLWVRQAWLDAHLAWDKDAYGGIDSIRIPSSYVWRPDIIILYNEWVLLALPHPPAAPGAGGAEAGAGGVANGEQGGPGVGDVGRRSPRLGEKAAAGGAGISLVCHPPGSWDVPPRG